MSERPMSERPVSERPVSLIDGKLRAELARAYAAPERHYHNLAHIEAMLSLMRSHENAFSDPQVVEAAIWFHDAIYDTRQHDNEERSAELATSRLAGRLSPDRLALIAKMIRATAGHHVPEGLDDTQQRDCALFLDLDLAILGSTPDAFAAYETAVRREYAWVPDALWRDGRRKVLQSFIDRPAIYASPQFQTSHESAARANLTRSLERLARP
jgi:predicted metal-dependent HD superfamily phosphohydrolase